MTNYLFVPRAALALALTMLAPCMLAAQGVKTDTPTPIPVAQPQYANITSTNNAIQISRLPITDNGEVYYVDVTLTADFNVGPDGKVAFNLVPTVLGSPNLVANNFKAGTYLGPADVNGGKNIIVVTGPSAEPGGGSAWTLNVGGDASGYTYPSFAQWFVQPVASNPFYSRIAAAKITAQTSSAYSFGIGDSGSNPNSAWPPNSLLGFNQVGNTVVVSSFTSSYLGGDQPLPVDTIVYTLQP